ncbi:hypothetical protein LCGC14_0920060 [marine sediment metagenome]|uniref:Uncharacterized protein n=1 Tax=marine sediment metagenome TaxID=412755 RepID=A0A0F9PBR5_9ZZZZ
MNLQFYEMMDDKSKEYLLYLIEQILPKFTKSELAIYLEDMAITPIKGSKSSKSKAIKGYVKIGGDTEKAADLSKLNTEQLKSLFQIYISREKNDKIAVKWRFYQYLKYMLDLDIKSIQVNRDPNPDRQIDFIIETKENEVIIALCQDILELSNYNKAINEIAEFAKKENTIPDKVIFATSKSFRNIPLDTPIKILNKEILPILWVEWVDEDRRFKKEDLLIVNNSELKVAGFNFSSVDDMLNYIYKFTDGGQISIFRQLDFFTEVSDDEPEVEIIWKGIMLKQ